MSERIERIEWAERMRLRDKLLRSAAHTPVSKRAWLAPIDRAFIAGIRYAAALIVRRERRASEPGTGTAK